VVRVAVKDTVVGDMAVVREVIFVEEDEEVEVAALNNMELCRSGRDTRVALFRERGL